MAMDIFKNGLLGMGGLGGGQANMPANSLLGQFYDPAEMRKYQLKQMLLGLGAGLMAEKGFGKGAAMGLAAGDLAGRSYRENAMDAYKLKMAQDEQTYQRGRDAKSDADAEREYQLRLKQYNDELKRQQRQDAYTATQNQHTMEEWQRADDLRQGKQDYVTGWMGDQTQQGASLPFSPGVRSIARQGGLAGPSSADQWRFDNAQPYVGAQDFGNAFTQITAQPPKPEQYTLGPGQQRRDEYGNVLAEGPPKTPDTVINNNGDMKLTEAQSKDVHYYARGKYANADLTANEGALLALGQQQGSNVPVVGNYLKSPEYRQAERAGKEFLAMILRKESGGAITREEWQEYGPMFLPMPGDDQQTLADKRAARQRALDALKLGGGTATPLFDQIDQKFSAESGSADPAANLKQKYGLE